MARDEDIPPLSETGLRAIERHLAEAQNYIARNQDEPVDILRYTRDVTALLAEVERLRAREAALVAVARVVADGPLSYDGFGGYTCAHCEQEFMEHPDPDDDQPGAIEHTADCPVTQARAWLASEPDDQGEA